MDYECKRCGYTSPYKHTVIRHLQKDNICIPSKEDICRAVLISQLQIRTTYNEVTYSCSHCNRKFNNRSSKCRHSQTCKKNPNNITISVTKYGEVVQRLNKLEQEQKDVVNQEHKKKQQKDEEAKKLEAFYQMHLEKYLGGTHKRLKSGITDISTDNTLAEIKRWSCYKEAIGQLVCYNQEDPKDNIHLYLFGKYSKLLKEKVVFHCNLLKFKAFALLDEDGYIHVEDLTTSDIVHSIEIQEL